MKKQKKKHLYNGCSFEILTSRILIFYDVFLNNGREKEKPIKVGVKVKKVAKENKFGKIENPIHPRNLYIVPKEEKRNEEESPLQKRTYLFLNKFWQRFTINRPAKRLT